jgi:hypothetical protein
VPVEIGASIRLKNIGSALCGYGRHEEYTWAETFWAGLLMPAAPSEPTCSGLKTPCGLVRRVPIRHSYGVCTCVSVSMLTRVALIVPLIGGPAGVLPSGINCAISKVPV